MRIILLGAPGAGKGTQADSIKGKYPVAHISTGDILRANVKAGTELGKSAKEYMDAGKLVPDEVIIGMMEKRLQEADCKDGFLLDGFPRTIGQAEALDVMLAKLGIKLDAVVSLAIDDDTVVGRLTARRVCRQCGEIYNTVLKPAAKEGVCDKCGGGLIIRKDDEPETVRDRLKTYHEQTEPLKDFYAQRGKLVSVDNQPTIEATTAAIEKALGLE